MYVGWHQIDGKWYYFNEVSDGTLGKLLTNTWIDGWYVDNDGVWNGEQRNNEKINSRVTESNLQSPCCWCAVFRQWRQEKIPKQRKPGGLASKRGGEV